MSNRIVLSASGKDFEKYFEMEIQDKTILSPSYNIAPEQEIVIVTGQDDETALAQCNWGLADEDNGQHAVGVMEALRGLEEGIFKRCVIPVSGYYKWKNNGKRAEYPFFIRMLNDPIMALAGIMGKEARNGEDRQGCAIIQTESNALIQPLDPKMPLQLDRRLSKKWLDNDFDHREVIREAQKLFLMTEMTVLRVSDRVNDLSVNSADLIQPLPK